jgi:hypothetical protein
MGMGWGLQGGLGTGFMELGEIFGPDLRKAKRERVNDERAGKQLDSQLAVDQASIRNTDDSIRSRGEHDDIARAGERRSQELHPTQVAEAKARLSVEQARLTDLQRQLEVETVPIRKQRIEQEMAKVTADIAQSNAAIRASDQSVKTQAALARRYDADAVDDVARRRLLNAQAGKAEAELKAWERTQTPSAIAAREMAPEAANYRELVEKANAGQMDPIRMAYNRETGAFEYGSQNPMQNPTRAAAIQGDLQRYAEELAEGEIRAMEAEAINQKKQPFAHRDPDPKLDHRAQAKSLLVRKYMASLLRLPDQAQASSGVGATASTATSDGL